MMTGNGVPAPAPLYVRALRLRQLRVGGFLSFLLFECMIAIGVLLALAELVSWWAVPILPAAVAVMVKVNDVVAGPRLRRRQQTVARAAADRDGVAWRGDLAGAPDDERVGVAGRQRTGGAAERARTAAGRGGAGSPGQGRPTQQSGSRERLDTAGDGSKSGDTQQRRHVGVIRIAVPPRDRSSTSGGAQREAAANAERAGREAQRAGTGAGRAATGAEQAGASAGRAATGAGADRTVAGRGGAERSAAGTGGGAERAAMSSGAEGTAAGTGAGPTAGGGSGAGGRMLNGGTVGATSGRHARAHRTGGGRYADDGYVSNGRHSDGVRRGDDETTRQRGTLNQGRFA